MRRLLIFLLLASVISVSAIWLIVGLGNKQTLSVKLPSGVSAKVMTAYEGDTQPEGYTEKQVSSLGESTTVKIKKGSYTLVTSNTEGLEDKTTPFTLSDKPLTLNINLDYSKDKLAEVLVKEKGDIIASLNSKYPIQMGNYDVAELTLAKKGEWAISALKSKNSNEDTLRMVLHKTGNSWEVAAVPNLVLSNIDYPTIPIDILQSANRLR